MRQLGMLVGILFLTAAPRSGSAQRMAERDPLVVWGTIERLYSSERLLVRSDDDRLYSVRARGADVELTGGDLGRWDDLRLGQQVDVFGTATVERDIDATHIRITGGRAVPGPDRDSADNQDRYRGDRYRVDAVTIELLGTVTGVDSERESIRLRTRRGLRTVEVYDQTVLRFDTGRRASLRDIRAGDELSVRGEDRDGRIVADRVTLLGPAGSSYPEGYPDDRRSDREDAVLTGTVRGSTNYVSRRLTLRTSEGDIRVDVPPDSRIYMYDDRISVHELESGDRVRVVGRWDGPDRFRALRIDVSPRRPARMMTRGYRASLQAQSPPVVTILGQLVSFDERRDRMRLSTSQGDRIVVANGLPGYVHGVRISRRNFQQGDRVRATGYWNGREIVATRVELAY